MRADRLVSILMLLQSRGRVQAPELAEQLGVSVRTIYRDMDALSAAGIPVYAERGAEGGCCLVEDYRTDLTGLNVDEAHALFLLSTPGPLDALEVGGKLRSALRKLAAALPGYLSPSETSQAHIHLDWSGWNQRAGAGAHLERLYQAVQRREQVEIAYRMQTGMEVEVEQVVAPLGLVAKAGEWYLGWQIYQKIHFRRVTELDRVTPTGRFFDPPPHFDLAAAWQTNLADWAAWRENYLVQARVLPRAAAELRRRGIGLNEPAAGPDAAGYLRVELAFSSLEAACQNLMGLGRAVEVLAPIPLRHVLIDYARQVLGMYPA